MHKKIVDSLPQLQFRYLCYEPTSFFTLKMLVYTRLATLYVFCYFSIYQRYIENNESKPSARNTIVKCPSKRKKIQKTKKWENTVDESGLVRTY